MHDPETPNNKRSADDGLSAAGPSGTRPEQELENATDPPSVETTITDSAHVLDEFGEDIASSPAQRAKPKPGPPAKSQ